jgi:hypothetical protein
MSKKHEAICTDKKRGKKKIPKQITDQAEGTDVSRIASMVRRTGILGSSKNTCCLTYLGPR